LSATDQPHGHTSLYGDVPEEILEGFAEQGFNMTVMPEHNSFLALIE
jgi:hypothetical protein